MAQAMIDKRRNYSDSYCQTGNPQENVFRLSDSKFLKFYYSNVFKQHVVSLSLSSTKSFIFTLKLWKIFRKYIPLIEEYFEHDKNNI
jgi:hypothetical protein